MTTVEITTRTDLTTGRKVYILPANPVPVITPMGPAPGELQVHTEPDGKVTAVQAVLRPRGADVAAIADLLVRLATFKLDARELRGLASGSPIVTFGLRPDALAQLGVTVRGAKDVEALLRSPILQAGERYAVEDVVVAP